MKKLFFLAAVALMIATSCNNQNNKTAQVTPDASQLQRQGAAHRQCGQQMRTDPSVRRP